MDDTARKVLPGFRSDVLRQASINSNDSSQDHFHHNQHGPACQGKEQKQCMETRADSSSAAQQIKRYSMATVALSEAQPQLRQLLALVVFSPDLA